MAPEKAAIWKTVDQEDQGFGWGRRPRSVGNIVKLAAGAEGEEGMVVVRLVCFGEVPEGVASC